MNATALCKLVVTSVVIGLLFIACQQPSPAPTTTPAPSPTITPSPSPEPTLTPLSTFTWTPTPAPSATATLEPTSAAAAQAVVINDPTGDWAYPAGPWLSAFGFPPPEELLDRPLPIPFIDLRSVTIRIEGDNLVIKYQVATLLPRTKEDFPVIEGQPITAFVIRMPIDVDRQWGSEAELFNGWSVLSDGRLHQDVSYLLDPPHGGGNEPFGFYSKKSARLTSGGPGHDYLEVSYPLGDLGLRADEVISMEIFAFASNEEQRTVSADFLDRVRCEGQGDCYNVRLGSGLVREPPVSSGGQRPPGITTLPSCGTKRELFSVSPFPVSQTITVMPLGAINPAGGHVIPRDQLEFFFPRTIMPDGTRTGPEVTVVAPTDMLINLVRVQRELTGAVGTKLDNYKLFFSPCREVTGYMVHLTTLVPKLMEQLVPPYEFAMADMRAGLLVGQAYEKVVSISVKAGEVLGTYGPAILGGELSLRDYRTPPLPWANPSHWPVNWRHVVCPLDYFALDVRSALWAKLGIYLHDGRRYAPEPTCGEVAQDVSGTAQGVWFMPNTQWGEAPNLSLIHDNWDPAVGVFSVGFSLQKSGVKLGSYHFVPSHTGLVNRDFKEVTADGQVYCYEVVESQGRPESALPSAIILQLTSPTTLRIEGRASPTCGSGPWQFGATYTDFER